MVRTAPLNEPPDQTVAPAGSGARILKTHSPGMGQEPDMRHRTLDREISPDGHFDWAQRQRLLRDRNGRSRQEIQIPAESGLALSSDT